MKKNLRKDQKKIIIEKFLTDNSSCTKIDVIEMILLLCDPAKENKNLAYLINKQFKNLRNFLAAERSELEKIVGLGGNVFVISLLQKIIVEILKEKILDQEVISSFNDIVKYFQFDLGAKSYEECKVLFLNSKNKIIKEELISRGSVSQVIIFPREILKKCIEIPCSSIILIHNHPSQEPSPSREDVENTRQTANLLRSIGVNVYDHIIVGMKEYFSFKHSGLL